MIRGVMTQSATPRARVRTIRKPRRGTITTENTSNQQLGIKSAVLMICQPVTTTPNWRQISEHHSTSVNACSLIVSPDWSTLPRSTNKAPVKPLHDLVWLSNLGRRSEIYRHENDIIPWSGNFEGQQLPTLTSLIAMLRISSLRFWLG